MSKYDSYSKPTTTNNNCRTCTDFKFWSKQQRQIFHKANDEDSTSKSDVNEHKQRSDCPLDKVGLGKATWGLLHTIAAFYDDNPTESQKQDVKVFLDTLSRLYPCGHCAEDFRKDLKKNPANVNSQVEFSKWLCNFHNRVNLKLDKPIFDCAKLNQRWRDGWLDGSCE